MPDLPPWYAPLCEFASFLPISPDKSPACKSYAATASTDANTVSGWRRWCPAVAAYIAKGSRLIVVDLDSPTKRPDAPDGPVAFGNGTLAKIPLYRRRKIRYAKSWIVCGGHGPVLPHRSPRRRRGQTVRNAIQLPRLVHTCDACGASGSWTPSWQYFGSIRDLEDYGRVLKVCSSECRARLESLGNLAHILCEVQIAEGRRRETASIKRKRASRIYSDPPNFAAPCARQGDSSARGLPMDQELEPRNLPARESEGK